MNGSEPEHSGEACAQRSSDPACRAGGRILAERNGIACSQLAWQVRAQGIGQVVGSVWNQRLQANGLGGDKTAEDPLVPARRFVSFRPEICRTTEYFVA
jgi:hypothetical protein